jgi:glycine/D-amino acid oxidase-like deaminating enzyme
VTYIIPRPRTSTFVLGGTKEAGKWSTEPDTDTMEEILERCQELCPVLEEVGIEVLAT